VKGGYVSKVEQSRNTGEAGVSSRCRNVGVSSDIATNTLIGSDCTGDNRLKFKLRYDKQLLCCIETVRLFVRK
jgi:hypothetical protein